MKTVLVTGGTGFIGSHTVVALIESGYRVVIADNLSNSFLEVLDRIEEVCGVKPFFCEVDILDEDTLGGLFSDFNIDSVVHFAGLKAVGESVEFPERYYRNNVEGSLSLLRVMDAHECRKLVFSSSSTVYGDPASVPILEDFPLGATNPYGHSKLVVESILRDYANANSAWKFSLLRYFNPVGAHPSGRLGEDPHGIPNNLMPFIAQVGVGRLKSLSVFGDDYPTPDGTGVRDYIHVVDLAEAHVKALTALEQQDGCRAFNIGTGGGFSVLEMVRAFEAASGVEIPYSIQPRRAGDIAESYADPNRAKVELGWEARLGINEIMRDQWNWQKNNPTGYRKEST